MEQEIELSDKSVYQLFNAYIILLKLLHKYIILYIIYII